MKFKNTIAAQQIFAYAKANGLDPKPILEKAKQYTKASPFKAWEKIKNHNRDRCLGQLFVWDTTEEGCVYWEEVNEYLPTD